MARSAVKRERLEARVSPEQKALFQRAADLTGRSLTDFVVSSVQAAAEETIRTHEVIRLSEGATRQIIEAMLNPPEPNDNLRRAYERHGEMFGS